MLVNGREYPRLDVPCKQCGGGPRHYYIYRHHGGGWQVHPQTLCKPCYDVYHAQKEREYNVRNRERVRAWRLTHQRQASMTGTRSQLRRLYGITFDDYLAMHKRQGGKCKICKQAIRPYGVGEHAMKDRACVDHDHRTGNVRGLLCYRCNFGLAYYEEWYKVYRLQIYNYIRRERELTKLREISRQKYEKLGGDKRARNALGQFVKVAVPKRFKVS